MQIYAIDVSKDYLDIFTTSEGGQKSCHRIRNNLAPICKLLEGIKDNDSICAEYTGVYTNLLAHLCHCYNIKIALVAGYDIKHSLGNKKGKTDALDAERIWEYAIRFRDKLKYSIPDNTAILELKALFRLRDQLVRALKALRSAHANNKHNATCVIAEYRVREQIELQLKQQIKTCEQQLLLIIETDQQLKQSLDLITSIPGVGIITAIEMIITTNNFMRIDSARKAAAYAGVCPYPNQSGNISKKARVHFRANKKLKSLLHMCAKTICLHNKEFKLYRDRKLLEGKHFYLVMNNVANKLIRIMYAVINTKEPFNIAMITTDQRFA